MCVIQFNNNTISESKIGIELDRKFTLITGK